MSLRPTRWIMILVFTSLFLGLSRTTFAQAPAISNADVVRMTQAGLAESVILSTIDNSPSTQFDVTPAGLVELKQARVIDAVIARMVARATAVVRPPANPVATASSPQTQTLSAPATRRRSSGLMWAGVGVWGGGLAMEILANTTMKKEECFVSAAFFLCESGTNKPLLWSGLGVAGAGVAMWIVGAQKVPALPSLRFGRRSASITYSMNF